MENEYGTPRGMRVPGKSRSTIRALALDLRSQLREYEPYIDVARLIEHSLFEQFGIVFGVQAKEVLGEDEGRTYPDKLRLDLREDVYQRLVDRDPRARFTAMHEVGHLVLHCEVPMRHSSAPSNHRPFEDSEWQSDAFAAEFLMPVDLIREMPHRTAAAASSLFGVSMRAAIIRLNVLNAEGVILLKR